MTCQTSVAILLSILTNALACTDSAIDVAPPGDASGATASDAALDSAAPLTTCQAEAHGTATEAVPAESELVLAWERTDGNFFVVRSRVTLAPDRLSFTVAMGPDAPPLDGRVAPSAPWIAVGHVYAVPAASSLEGVVDSTTLRDTMTAGTYEDAIVWTDKSRPGERADASWASRARPGYSVWRCSESKTKAEAFVESTCNGLRLEPGGELVGDRLCDWH